MRFNEQAFLDGVGEALADTGVATPLDARGTLGGGCIHAANRVATADGHALFLKSNDAGCAPMFAAEAAALSLLRVEDGPRVPAVLGHGISAGRAWLALEFIPLGGRGGDAAGLGRALAHLHACRGRYFGLDRDNFLGTTAQPNTPHDDWAAFWRTCRLGHQLALAAIDGRARLAERGRRLAERIEDLLGGHRPVPSPLHGDLWAGNHGYDEHGRGTVFDPAAYYGDREADLAMTELFGGFGADFHAAYTEAWPLEAGYAVRRDLYNLYHVLNHAHLFGGGYVHDAERRIERLLAECGD